MLATLSRPALDDPHNLLPNSDDELVTSDFSAEKRGLNVLRRFTVRVYKWRFLGVGSGCFGVQPPPQRHFLPISLKLWFCTFLQVMRSDPVPEGRSDRFGYLPRST